MQHNDIMVVQAVVLLLANEQMKVIFAGNKSHIHRCAVCSLN